MKKMIVPVVVGVVLLALVVVAAPPVAAPSQPPPTVKSAPTAVTHPEAVAAIRRFELAEQQAGRQFAQVVDQARAKLVKELTAVQDKVTRAGNLEEALRIRDAIVVAKDPGRAATRPAGSSSPGDNVMAADAIQLGKALAGSKWKKVNGPHKGFTILFRPDMGLTTDHHGMTGCWAPVAKDRVRISVSSSSCASELLTVGPDGRLMLDEEGQRDFEFLGR